MHDQLALVAFVFGEPAYGVAEDANVGRKVLREIRRSAKRDLGALCSCDGGDLVVIRADDDAGCARAGKGLTDRPSDQWLASNRQHVLARDALGTAARRNER
jgi:hypothetical protein